jgi:Putative peptidoglycan binding domain
VRDVSLSAQKFEDFSDDRAAAPRRAKAALPPDFGPAPIRERPALARFLRRPRIGFSILVGIAGLALVGVPLNALFLQDGRHPAPLFGARTLAPEPIQTAAKPAPRPAPEVARVEAEPIKAEPGHAKAAKPEARSDAAALTAEILKSAPPAPAQAAAPSKSVKKVVASRDAIGSLLGPVPKPAAVVKSATAAKPAAVAKPSAIPAPAAAAAPAAGPDQSVVSAQRALQRLGYVVKPDGAMTPEMRKTVEKFERDNGLPATGQLGPKVVKLLSTKTASQH